MATQWIRASKGIRYREHPSRKHGKRPDRYFTIFYKLNGKDVSEGIGWGSDGVTQDKCEKIALALRENRKTGTFPQTYKEMCQGQIDEAEAQRKQEQLEQSLTLQGIFEGAYQAAQTTKGQSAHKAEAQLMKNHIAPYFKDTPLKEITPSMMDSFLQHITQKKSIRTGRPLSAATVRYTLAVIRQIWNYALSRGLTESPYPAKRVKAPKIDNGRTRFLTRDEAERLLEALEARSQTTHDMALMSLFCGLRSAELFKLQWGDVNFQEGFILIRDRKNKDSGTAWMTPRVKAMLEDRYTEQAASDYVFPSTTGEVKNFVSKLFPKVVREIGFNNDVHDKRQRIVFHSLRHTFASWLAQKGVPLHSLAELMGHKTTTMTQRYAHLSPQGQKAHAMLIDEPAGANVIPFNKVQGEK